MLFTELIRKKRDARELNESDIQFFVDGLTSPDVPAEQISAFAMAVYFNSMSFRETELLTSAMARSGEMLTWAEQNLPGPVVDKHSTGGVGDKVSFLLAPIAAAVGCCVPMISGRGLGHSGGTLDKIGAIPGYQMFPDLPLFRKVVKEVGCAIIGQTSNLAPADRRFYAIRDITSTVESIPLITASILSKKIAAGNDALVMDVKCGNGAFMRTLGDAQNLSRSIIGTGELAGLKIHVLITDMNEVLGTTAGNAPEIQESVDYLRNTDREARLNKVVIALVSEMLMTTGLSKNLESAREKVEQAIVSGAAYEKFAQMVSALGGPVDFMTRTDNYLPKAKVVMPVLCERDGWLSSVDTRAMGNVIIELGGGRKQRNDSLDLSVGLSKVLPIGTAITKGQSLCMVHAQNRDAAEAGINAILSATQISEEVSTLNPTVLERLTG